MLQTRLSTGQWPEAKAARRERDLGIRAMRDNGMTLVAIGKASGLSRSWVGRILRRSGGVDRRPIAARFWPKMDKCAEDACWEWSAAKDNWGYGLFYGDSFTRAHRMAWVLTNGPIPEGLCVLHACDNPPCCNPAHLWLGTHLDNARDRENKGRGNH